MWIRFQNKEALVYANNFYIRKARVEEKYEISYFDGDSFVKLGFYKSKERAVEVLDEIQEKIINFEFGEANECLISNEVVYQMPKE